MFLGQSVDDDIELAKSWDVCQRRAVILMTTHMFKLNFNWELRFDGTDGANQINVLSVRMHPGLVLCCQICSDFVVAGEAHAAGCDLAACA